VIAGVQPMIPVTILFFLVGAVLAWRFRVWILVPVTLLAMIAIMMFELARGAGLVTASGYGLLGPAPQLGYAFGLLARNALVLVRSPRSASVATLYKRHYMGQSC
jgi:hypothetical protein